MKLDDCRIDIDDYKPGDRVTYVSQHGQREHGTVTSTNAHYVFVCFGLPGSTSKACRREDLRR